MPPHTQQLAELDQLLQRAEHAHHQAYLESDGNDPEWPLWYAEYLQQHLNLALNTSFTVSELVYHLIFATNKHSTEKAQKPWAEYTADYFLELMSGETA